MLYPALFNRVKTNGGKNNHICQANKKTPINSTTYLLVSMGSDGNENGDMLRMQPSLTHTPQGGKEIDPILVGRGQDNNVCSGHDNVEYQTHLRTNEWIVA